MKYASCQNEEMPDCMHISGTLECEEYDSAGIAQTAGNKQTDSDCRDCLECRKTKENYRPAHKQINYH